MRIIKNDDYKPTVKTVAALGNFDGLHIAHRKIIDTAVKIAQDNDIESVVYTFDVHPLSVLTGNAPKLLISEQEKQKLLDSYGVDCLYIQKFDKQFSSVTWEEFIQRILADKLNCSYVVAGYDYTFGKNAYGNISMLKSKCSLYQIEVVIVDEIDYLSAPVSSTRIRHLLKDGDITGVNEMLGRRYSMSGLIVKGESRGNKLGYPTANMQYDKQVELPALAVYATFLKYGDKTYRSVTSIGTKPTFSQIDHQNEIVCETHIIDCKDIDLYNKQVTVEFDRFIRFEKKFDNKTELIKAIQNDISLVNKIYG